MAFYALFMHTNNERINLTNSLFNTAPYRTCDCFFTIYTMNQSLKKKSVTSGFQPEPKYHTLLSGLSTGKHGTKTFVSLCYLALLDLTYGAQMVKRLPTMQETQV